MSQSFKRSLAFYAGLLSEIKTRIRHAQNRAVQAANTELLRLYWDIGTMLLVRQNAAGWGAGVIPRLARDLHNELPEIKGFSRRNIELMMRFAREYSSLFSIAQPLVAQIEHSANILPVSPPTSGKSDAKMASNSILQPVVAKLSARADSTAITSSIQDVLFAQPLVAQLPWAHNILLIYMVKDLPTRIWYMRQALEHGWSRNVLALMINNQVHLRQGKAITNFPQRLPPDQSDLAMQLLKDPYIFDFLTLEKPFHEHELETQLLEHLQKFLLELGQGFAFVGRQYRIRVGDTDFYIDLLFYHLRLRCFFTIDLKTQDFQAEHVGKMNFYLNVLDDKLRHSSDAPSIGLILCQKRDRIIAEYALRGVKKPIGISEYTLTRALPAALQSSLPSIEQIEAELAGHVQGPSAKRHAQSRPVRHRKPSASSKKTRK